MIRRQQRFVVALTLGLVTGCATTPEANFYTLSATSPPAERSSRPSIEVGPVSVPTQIDRPELVVTTGPNQVRLEAFHRWAAPVQDEVAGAVAANLAALLDTGHVTLAGRTLDAEYGVAIEVQRLESVFGRAATLDAFWEVRRARDGRAWAGRTTARENASQPTHAAIVAAHSRAVSRLSRDIAEAIRALD